MYVLDTNVVSELRRAERADPRVAAWARRTPLALHFIASVTLYELELGIVSFERKIAPRGQSFVPGWSARYCLDSRDAYFRSMRGSPSGLRRFTSRTEDLSATPSSLRLRSYTA